MPIDPRILCCAAGACCLAGSSEQSAALAEVMSEFEQAGINAEVTFHRLSLATAGAPLEPTDHAFRSRGGAV